MLAVEDLSDLVKQDEAALFANEIDILVTDNSATIKRATWDNDSIQRFNKEYRSYLTERRRDLNVARSHLSASISEIKTIRDEVLFYNKNLIEKIKRINNKLIADHKHILDNFDRLQFSSIDIKTFTRAMIACDEKFLDDTKTLCDKALIIIDQKSFKEKCYKFAKEHPVICIVGGVVVGVILGGIIYFVGAAALSQIGTIVIKEVAKEGIKQSLIYTASAAATEGAAAVCTVKTAVATTCVIGGIAGLVSSAILAINAEDLEKRLERKKVFEAEKCLLVRQIAKLTEEYDRQKELERQRQPKESKVSNN
jgi:hypothetical protein